MYEGVNPGPPARTTRTSPDPRLSKWIDVPSSDLTIAWLDCAAGRMAAINNSPLASAQPPFLMLASPAYRKKQHNRAFVLIRSETELTTAATDLLLGLVGAWLAWQLAGVPTSAVWQR